MKKTLLNTLLFLCTFTSLKAQENKIQISDDKTFIELVDLSTKFYFSQENINEFKLSNEFIKKMNSIKIENIEEYNSNLENWLKTNLDNTTFKSVNEGLKLHNKLFKIIEINELSRNIINSNSNLLIAKYGFDEFMDSYYKEISKINQIKLSELNLNCEEKFTFLEFNSFADFRCEISQVSENSMHELASKKLEKNLYNGTYIYEDCKGILQ